MQQHKIKSKHIS